MILPAKPPVARLPVSSLTDTGKPKLMNDLPNKSQLRRWQNAVLDEVKQCLTNKTSFGSRAIGYLIFEHLKSDPTWAYPECSIDFVGQLMLTVTDTQVVHVIGLIEWKDERHSLRRDDLFEAKLQLVQTSEGGALDYTILFCAEGVVRRITPASFEWAGIDDPDVFLPDLDQLHALLIQTSDETGDDEFNRHRMRIHVAGLLGKSGIQGHKRLLAALDQPDSTVHISVLIAIGYLIEEIDFTPPPLEHFLTDTDETVRTLAVTTYFQAFQQLPAEFIPARVAQDLFQVLTESNCRIVGKRLLRRRLIPVFAWLLEQDKGLIDFLICSLSLEGEGKCLAVNCLDSIPSLTEEQFATLFQIFSSEIQQGEDSIGVFLWERGHPVVRQQYWEALLDKQSPIHQKACTLILDGSYDWREAPELIAGYWKLVEPHDKLRLIHKLARRRNRLRIVRAHFREITPQLLEWLHHPDFSIQSEAAEALAAIGENAELVVPALLEKLRPFADNPEDFSAEFEDRPSFLRNVIESLGRFGPAAIPAIPMIYRIGASLESKRYLLTRIIESLPEFGPEGVRALFSLVRSREDDYVRDWRVRRTLVPYGATFVPQLIEAMNIPELQPMVVQTLLAIGPEAKAAIPILLHAFHHPNTCGRTALADCFGCIGEGDPAVIAALNSVTRDADLELRLMAIDALRRIGKPATDVLRDLVQYPPTEAPDLTLCWALNALSECGDESHETQILCQNRLSHPSAGVTFFARCVLGKMSCPDPAGNVSVR